MEKLTDPRARSSPLAAAIAELKAEARAAGLTDADIDAELAAYNAERRETQDLTRLVREGIDSGRGLDADEVFAELRSKFGN